MFMLFLVIIPSCLLVLKLIIYLIVRKFGNFSYDGFSAAGFAYSSEKDIFYSTRNAWQKNFGYTHFYDVMAPVFRMIIDTEPIRFFYSNKNWLITFWKGQYGIVTGAEIGIYATSEKKVNKRTVYLPVLDDEMLDMDLILYKNGKVITKVRAKHWWLAVFKLGMFSRPKDLVMDLNLTFPNKDMLDAFLESFKKLGYKDKDYKVIDNSFCFKYVKPYTRKVWTRMWPSDYIRQYFNKKNVNLYNKFIGEFVDENNSSEKNIMINDFVPDFLKEASEKEKEGIANRLVNKNVFLNNIVYSGVKNEKA